MCVVFLTFCFKKRFPKQKNRFPRFKNRFPSKVDSQNKGTDSEPAPLMGASGPIWAEGWSSLVCGPVGSCLETSAQLGPFS